MKAQRAATKKREEATRKILGSEGMHEMFFLEVDENEIRETALRLAQIASSYNMVVGGSAAEKVASAAGVEGHIIPSFASAALVKAMNSQNWFPGRRPSDGKAWLDTVGVALQQSPHDNRLLQGCYSRATDKRGVKRERS